MKDYIKRLLHNKEATNASWLIGARIIQMLISLFVGILIARYLGPSNYGLINYAGAYVAFFTALCNLGINSIIVKNFVDHPDEQGKMIGSTLVLRFASSALSCGIIFVISLFADAGEPTTILVVVLCSISLIFHIFETFNFWFQSRYESKITAIATFTAYVVTSIYKIILLIMNKNVLWFAFATSIDYIVVAVLLYIFYRKAGGPKLSFSLEKSKQLLSSSYHFILSGLMVAIYGYTDKFMLKQMLNSTEVGYYSTATAICGMWVFVLQAIIDSMYPTIMRLYKTDKVAFERKNKQLYCIVFYVSMLVSVMFSLFATLIIRILYGVDYLGAVSPLRIVTWYTAFSYLGVARNAWIVCENKQKYLKYMYLSAAIINMVLNALFIPIWAASGAALASLITQICTSLILPFMFKEMRPNCILMLQAILPSNVLRHFKDFFKK